MLDFGASTNVMSLKIMKQLGLKVTRPYHKICVMDKREVEVLGVRKNLDFRLKMHIDDP
jgi:hypothetical protein